MSSIPNSAMPHAVARDEPEASGVVLMSFSPSTLVPTRTM